MIFTMIGKVVAWMAIVLGVFMAITSWSDYSRFLYLPVGTETISSNGQVGKMTLEDIKANLAMHSQMTEVGIGMAMFGLVLGVLTEMRPRAQK
jgi:hypothetical protein